MLIGWPSSRYMKGCGIVIASSPFKIPRMDLLWRGRSSSRANHVGFPPPPPPKMQCQCGIVRWRPQKKKNNDRTNGRGQWVCGLQSLRLPHQCSWPMLDGGQVTIFRRQYMSPCPQRRPVIWHPNQPIEPQAHSASLSAYRHTGRRADQAARQHQTIDRPRFPPANCTDFQGPTRNRRR